MVRVFNGTGTIIQEAMQAERRKRLMFVITWSRYVNACLSSCPARAKL